MFFFHTCKPTQKIVSAIIHLLFKYFIQKTFLDNKSFTSFQYICSDFWLQW